MSDTTSAVPSITMSATADDVPNKPISVALAATVPMSVASFDTAVIAELIPATVLM